MLPLDRSPSLDQRHGGDAFLRVEGDPTLGLILLCDHASNRIPEEYGDLGLAAQDLLRHIAYDPGAAAVTMALAHRLRAPAIMSNFSRLLIDANRGEDDPTLIMRLSDGVIVLGNAELDDHERRKRVARFHASYHAAITATIDDCILRGVVPALVSIHSFTPVWHGRPRPWHVGVLWDRDPRLAVPLIGALAADTTFAVGDNEPYSGALANDTLYHHGTRRGLAHALIEIRQDLIADRVGAEEWAKRLADIFVQLNERPEIHQVEHYGSSTGPVDPK